LILSLAFIGFSVEAVGRHRHSFGSYAYSDVFGFKIFDTFQLIGVSGCFSIEYIRYCSIFYNRFGYLTSPLLMTALDYFVEPVAMALGFGIGKMMIHCKII
jgi:putative membrane protein